MPKLAVEKRDTLGKEVKNLRKRGMVPAGFYGRKEASTPITVAEKDFKKVFKEAGESTVVTLEGVGEEKDALIHDVERDPVTGAIRHVDFYVLEKGKKVEVEVPLTFIGVSPAVKDMGGTLVKVMHALPIEALPKDLPHGIEVDISVLVTLESKIHVKDLKLPSGVEAKSAPEEVVALVAEYKEEVEEVAAPIDLSAIEVEKKGKEANAAEGVAEGAEPEDK